MQVLWAIRSGDYCGIGSGGLGQQGPPQPGGKLLGQCGLPCIFYPGQHHDGRGIQSSKSHRHGGLKWRVLPGSSSLTQVCSSTDISLLSRSSSVRSSKIAQRGGEVPDDVGPQQQASPAVDRASMSSGMPLDDRCRTGPAHAGLAEPRAERSEICGQAVASDAQALQRARARPTTGAGCRVCFCPARVSRKQSKPPEPGSRPPSISACSGPGATPAPAVPRGGFVVRPNSAP